jgi:alkanesulfonate monooxygenase SsuD/methylene tetrahydromethanopterin reductase-like flavin-dependent oxidoreductase (luciferase family)
MKLGLQIPSFTWPDGPSELRRTLAHIARAAEDAGFTRFWVMDHFFQIGRLGKVDESMLVRLQRVHEISPIEGMSKEVIPAVADF